MDVDGDDGWDASATSSERRQGLDEEWAEPVWIRELTEECSQGLAAAAARVTTSQAAPLQIVDVAGNQYPLAIGWWSVPGGDLVAMALAQHPALVEANQRFELVTSDGAAAPATVPLLLAGLTPSKAALVWLADDAPAP